ncbi:hypothetical protein SAMN06295888_1594 [Desulfonatronum zhilinae]|nr:hypothetical protein SAMN06295888_1594 [Desulfonatronum zhilinae]
MKNVFGVIACCMLLFFGTFATAQTAHDSHTDHGAPEAPVDAAEFEATEQGVNERMEMMQGHMQGMKARMEKIKAATTPQERRELMKAQMGDMKKGMAMMKDMPKCPMMSGHEKKGEGNGMMGAGMMKCSKMMHEKMEMMQIMMEGLLEESSATQE